MSERLELQKLLEIARGARDKAELDLIDERERFRQEVERIRSATQDIGGRFIKREHEGLQMSELVERRVVNSGDNIVLYWSKLAKVSGLATSSCYAISAIEYVTLPYEVRAKNWWHLCSQVGLIEVAARAFYYHPEEGQPSAVENL